MFYNSHMPPSPAVSVVLTVHNRPRHLAEAAGSILSQTFRDLELLIVDDCSDNPQTQALAKQIAENDPRVRILRRDANGGPAAARNTGAAQARAKLIAFMDDDDISEPNRLEKQVAFLAENPEVASVSCRKIVVDQRGNFLRHHSPPRATVALSRPKPFVGGAGECDRAVPPASEGEYAPLNASAVVRRECFEAIGGYRECYRAAEDHDIILRMQERFAMAELPEELYRYRRPDDANVSTSPHNWRANIAIEISARRRRLGFPDPMAEGRQPDDDFLLSHFGGLPLPRRIYFIGKFAGPSRRLIRAESAESCAECCLSRSACVKPAPSAASCSASACALLGGACFSPSADPRAGAHAPVGDCIPDRNDPPPLNPCAEGEIGF